MSDRPTVLLALSPLVEQDIAPLLFGDQPAVTVAASLVELAALERTLAGTETRPEALLVSADLPDLTAGLLSHARTQGLRLIGIATDAHDATLLRDLPLDTTLTTPLDPHALQTAIRPAEPDRLRRGPGLVVHTFSLSSLTCSSTWCSSSNSAGGR